MLLTAYKKRWKCYTLTVTDADGATIPFVSGDVMRVKIGRSLSVLPILDLDSAAASSNGSSLTAANPTTMKLVANDADLFDAGTYDIEVGIVDDSDNDNFKHAITGIFQVHDTQLGDVGIS